MLQKFRAAFTAWNERIKPEYVINKTDEELYQVSQILLIKERVVILETDQYQQSRQLCLSTPHFNLPDEIININFIMLYELVK